jgi:hypothetical protein
MASPALLRATAGSTGCAVANATLLRLTGKRIGGVYTCLRMTDDCIQHDGEWHIDELVSEENSL